MRTRELVTLAGIIRLQYVMSAVPQARLALEHVARDVADFYTKTALDRDCFLGACGITGEE